MADLSEVRENFVFEARTLYLVRRFEGGHILLNRRETADLGFQTSADVPQMSGKQRLIVVRHAAITTRMTAFQSLNF